MSDADNFTQRSGSCLSYVQGVANNRSHKTEVRQRSSGDPRTLISTNRPSTMLIKYCGSGDDMHKKVPCFVSAFLA